ncbi:hypothetical protein CEXT_220061 [Caerostris extrusa]|uniref:Uncharacterized protein n=1 Tax=Caerostris extrusa TaxID=172846 RepID=A0AAV4NF69_CAEEX|nr:hypothetical protein CEXT_220061 [Caerostris extrusa]
MLIKTCLWVEIPYKTITVQHQCKEKVSNYTTKVANHFFGCYLRSYGHCTFAHDSMQDSLPPQHDLPFQAEIDSPDNCLQYVPLEEEGVRISFSVH